MRTSGGEILLTGATGFVGMELLARHLERTERKIVTVVRASGDDEAQARVRETIHNLFGIRGERFVDRVQAVAGDLTARGLGLSPTMRDELAGRVQTIVHCAASVAFTSPLAQARAINLTGTSRMLDFAGLAVTRGGLERFAHVSTAYVAGTHSGRFSEADLDLGQGFNNSYEQSKFEAEQLVRARPDVPSTILRPSIVVGDRRSGWTAAFNVLYWPLRAFARGLFTAVPAIPSAPVDVVSVDYVADAIHSLCESPYSIGETYNLTAGVHASTMGEIAGVASRYFRRPLPEVLSPKDFAALARNSSAAQRSALESSAAYFPYFANGTVFDNTQARAHLDPVGIQVSPLGEYLERLLDFATLSRWGKRPIARAEALAT